jgi:hypothetical protein
MASVWCWNQLARVLLRFLHLCCPRDVAAAQENFAATVRPIGILLVTGWPVGFLIYWGRRCCYWLGGQPLMLLLFRNCSQCWEETLASCSRLKLLCCCWNEVHNLFWRDWEEQICWWWSEVAELLRNVSASLQKPVTTVMISYWFAEMSCWWY